MKGDELVERLKDYVLKLEFDLRVSPLEKIAYGLIGLILLSVMGALIALVIRK